MVNRHQIKQFLINMKYEVAYLKNDRDIHRKIYMHKLHIPFNYYSYARIYSSD